LGISEGLLGGAPDDRAIQELVYQARMGLGLVDMRVEQFDAAQRRFRSAVSMAESIAAVNPRETAARRDLIEAYLPRARSHSFAHEFGDAKVWFQEMHDLAHRWVAEEPAQNQARDLLASALRKLADLQKFDKDFASATQTYERAIEIGEALVRAEPQS